MEIKTKRYENENGKKPRGHGFWFFNYTVVCGGSRMVWHEPGFTGSYSSAKKEALKSAKQFRAVSVEVNP